MLLTSEMIPVQQWAAGQEEGRDSSCWACRVHRAGMGSFSEKNEEISKPFLPALWESRLGVNCPRLGHDISFLSSSFPHQVFHADSGDLKDQGFGAVQGLPRKEGNLWSKGEGQQTVRLDQQSPRSCGKPKEPSQRRGREPQP